MFPDNIKNLYEGIAFDELCFQCIFCQSGFQRFESVDDLLDFHKKSCKIIRHDCSPSNIPTQFFRGDKYNYQKFLKLENRLKTYNPFLFPEFKTILQLAEAGFICTGIDFSLGPSDDNDTSYEDEEIVTC